jgi:hypothetical protein
VVVLVSVCAVVVAALVPVLLLLAHRDDTARRAVAAVTPSAGPLCRAAGCEGRDPLATGCAAAPGTLAEHRTATGATVQLRDSAVCGTSWARMWGARIGDRVEVTTAGADARTHVARVTDRTEADTYVHTLMSVTQPGTLVRACFLPAAPHGARECFRAAADHDPASPAASAPASADASVSAPLP